MKNNENHGLTLTPTPQPAWWSWKDVLKHSENLGIPHFQRGQVWGRGNRSALLESMYEASPCGTFVLWQPDDISENEKIGVPLFDGVPTDADMTWLVDGQQRTRSMVAVYQKILSAGELLGSDVCRELSEWMIHPLPSKEDVPPDEKAKTWYAILPQVSFPDNLFGNWSNSPQVLRGSLFRTLSPTERRKQRVPLPRGAVPLGVLLVAESGPFVMGTTRENVLRALGGPALDNDTLDELIPWGPQFATGFSYELSEDGKRLPIRWDAIPEQDEGLVRILKQLIIGCDTGWLQKFQNMVQGPRFAVGHLPRKGLGSAISAYVRINRAGVRVQPEEQALALLTRWDEGIMDYLARFCMIRDHQDSEAKDRRSNLVHGSDRQMGFSLWMSTVTRYTALFLMARSARHWDGVSALNRHSFADEFEKRWDSKKRNFSTRQELVAKAANQASEALLLIDSILSTELLLDHRMARRDTTSIQPLVEILSYLEPHEFESVKKTERLREALGFLLHLTMLGPNMPTGGMQSLRDAIHTELDVPDGQWAFCSCKGPTGNPSSDSVFGKLLRRYVNALHHLWASQMTNRNAEDEILSIDDKLQALSSIALRQFDQDVADARSLQHRAVGWLYAIERRKEAFEFDWDTQFIAYKTDQNQKVGIQRPENSEEFVTEPLAAHPSDTDLHPEKQHIIPFSKAQKIAGIRGSRVTASEANAIGNLTWISARQNGFKHGFSDRWAIFDDRSQETRGMTSVVSGSPSGKTAMDLYLELQREITVAETEKDSERLKVSEWPEAFAKTFTDFRDARTSWMKQQMREWLNSELSENVRHWLMR